MKEKIINNLKLCLPPLVLSAAKKYFYKHKSIYFSGDYASWGEALAETETYSASNIINKVHQAANQVKLGNASFERDSVLFYKPMYNWYVVSLLLFCASLNNNKLRLLDFGGSLGSTYYQNKELLLGLTELRWCVIEQQQFVEIGKNEFQNESLKFYYSIDECYKNGTVEVAFLSSVLQYLKQPYDILNELIKRDVKTIILDRTGFISGQHDRLTIQHISKKIYKATYPAWFLSESKIIDFMQENKYKLKAEIDCEDFSNIKNTYYKGLFFTL